MKTHGLWSAPTTSKRLALTIVVAGAAAVWPAGALAATGPAVAPTALGQSQNPATCAAAGIPSTTTLTDDNNQSGTHVASDSNATIMVTITDGTTLSFDATKLPQNELILGVVVKGGSNGGNVYNYTTLPAGGVTFDNNLSPGATGNGGETAGISHVLFCYGTPTPHQSGGTTPPPTSTPPKTTTPPPTAVKGTAKHKKRKHHKKTKHQVKPRRRITSPSFTG